MVRPCLVLVLILVLCGCSREEEAPQSVEQAVAAAPVRAGSAVRVVVPPEVAGLWQSVKVAVHDKELDLEQVLTVAIGDEVAVPGTTLGLRVLNFLPEFIMDETNMTSASGETNNPAAQVVVTDEGQEIFRGWLFSLYPRVHAFQHERFSFSLVDFLASKKKG